MAINSLPLIPFDYNSIWREAGPIWLIGTLFVKHAKNIPLYLTEREKKKNCNLFQFLKFLFNNYFQFNTQNSLLKMQHDAMYLSVNKKTGNR